MSTNLKNKVRLKSHAEALKLIEKPASEATVEDVKVLLQYALEIERFTLPPYLTALYSINAGTNAESVAIIRSVVVEEMLHMTLVCNVLNWLGGAPDLRYWTAEHDYPHPLPYAEPTQAPPINIERFWPDSVAAFQGIEQPGSGALGPNEFFELSQFYRYIQQALLWKKTNEPHTLGVGDPGRQVGPQHYYSAGGMIIPIFNTESAIAALQLIIQEGEGEDDGTGTSAGDEQFNQAYEPAHYYRFLSITACRFYLKGDPPGKPSGPAFTVDYNATANIPLNLSLADLSAFPDIAAKATDFLNAWSTLLTSLNVAFNGQPDTLQAAVAQMFALKYAAQSLMRLPLDAGYVAGPIWNLTDLPPP